MYVEGVAQHVRSRDMFGVRSFDQCVWAFVMRSCDDDRSTLKGVRAHWQRSSAFPSITTHIIPEQNNVWECGGPLHFTTFTYTHKHTHPLQSRSVAHIMDDPRTHMNRTHSLSLSNRVWFHRYLSGSERSLRNDGSMEKDVRKTEESWQLQERAKDVPVVCSLMMWEMKSRRYIFPI